MANRREKGEVTNFIFLSSQITADGDCSHEIKRHLLLGRNAMANLDSILKSRDILLLTKICLVKVIVFPVVIYGCESWIMKKAECWILLDGFELCWRKHFRVPWPARRSNQSILKEISLEYSVEGLMLELELQYFGHPRRRTDSLEIVWHHWLDGHEFKQALRVDDGQGSLECCSQWGHRVEHDWATELNWECPSLPPPHFIEVWLIN